MTLKDDAKRIRKIIKKKCPTVKVRMGKGTARSWIDLAGSGKYGYFTKKELNCLKQFKIGPLGLTGGVMSPDDKKQFFKKYGR